MVDQGCNEDLSEESPRSITSGLHEKFADFSNHMLQRRLTDCQGLSDMQNIGFSKEVQNIHCVQIFNVLHADGYLKYDYCAKSHHSYLCE